MGARLAFLNPSPNTSLCGELLLHTLGQEGVGVGPDLQKVGGGPHHPLPPLNPSQSASKQVIYESPGETPPPSCPPILSGHTPPFIIHCCPNPISNLT